jgi:hypothetical protein
VSPRVGRTDDEGGAEDKGKRSMLWGAGAVRAAVVKAAERVEGFEGIGILDLAVQEVTRRRRIREEPYRIGTGCEISDALFWSRVQCGAGARR